MEEDVTLVRIYETNKQVGYNADVLLDENTVDTYMRVIAVMEYVKMKLLKKLDLED